MFLLILLGAVLALFTAENGLVGAIVLLVLGIVLSLPCIIVAIMCATIGYEKITVSGRQISIKRLWGTRTYDCSEIAKIKCGRKHFEALGTNVHFDVADTYEKFKTDVVD